MVENVEDIILWTTKCSSETLVTNSVGFGTKCSSVALLGNFVGFGTKGSSVALVENLVVFGIKYDRSVVRNEVTMCYEITGERGGGGVPCEMRRGLSMKHVGDVV